METTSSDVFVESIGIAWESVGEGVRRKILSYSPKMMVTHVEFRRGAIGPIHHHPHTQMTFIEQGSFEVTIGNATRVLCAGDCFYIPPDVDHGVLALEDGRLVDVFTPIREDFLSTAKR